MKTDWSNYTITYDGTDYGVHYRDGINLVACETYVPNSPTTAYPATITNTGDLVTNADDDWNTAIAYGKTSFVGTAPSALGVDCYRVPIKITNGEEEGGEDYEEQIFNLYLDAPLRYGDTLDETGLLTRNSAKVILKGTEYWMLYNGNYYSNVVDAYSKTNTIPLCSHLSGASQIIIPTGTNRLKLFASALPAEVVDVASLKTWLAANPMTVIYTLAAPTTSTNYTMPSSIDTYTGTTIIQLDTTTQPAMLEAEYWSTEET